MKKNAIVSVIPCQYNSDCIPNYFQEGGPIGLIQNGDIINIDVQKRRIDVQLTDEEMEERRRKWTPPPNKVNRGVLYKVWK